MTINNNSEKMDDNTLQNLASVLRSMYFYGKKNEQYTQTTYNTWLANHATEAEEIKKIYANFDFARITVATYAYFKFKKDRSYVLNKVDINFLNIMGNLNIFADSDELDDLRDEFLKTAAPAAVGGVNSLPVPSMKIGSKINVDKLSGMDPEVDISEWFDSFETLGGSVGWNGAILGTQLPSYLSETALLIWKNMKTKRDEYAHIKKTILDELEVDRSYLKEFCSRVQKDSESVVEFSQKLQWLAVKAEIDSGSVDKQLLKQFWDGLIPKVKSMVLSSQPKLLKEGVMIAREAEKFLREQETAKQINLAAQTPKTETKANSFERANPRDYSLGSNSGSEYQSFAGGYSKSNRMYRQRDDRSWTGHSPSMGLDRSRNFSGSKSPDKRGETDRRRTQTPRSSYRAPLRECYTCGDKGHVAKDCKKSKENRACFKCGEKGHIARDCSKNF